MRTRRSVRRFLKVRFDLETFSELEYFTNTPQTPQQTTKRTSLGTTTTKRKKMQRLLLHSRALLRRLQPVLLLSQNPQLATH
jgi:hypothetical protein